MIYGYIVDEALHKWSTNALLGSAVNQGAAYASENVLEYFNKVSVVRDNRSSRYAYMGSGITMKGSIGFLTDSQPPDSDGCATHDESSDAIVPESLNYAGLTESDISKLFNIIEDVLYFRSGIGSTSLVDFLNSRFTSNSSSYSGYKVGTLNISSGTSKAPSNVSTTDDASFSAMTGMDSAGNVVAASNLSVPEWFSFNFETTNIGTISLKFWVRESIFRADYPYSTITNVVFPCDVNHLAYPSLWGSQPLSALINSGSFVNNIYKSDLATNESTGVCIYQASYYPETYSGNNTISIPFGVIYKGSIPTESLLKKAIRKKLLEEGVKQSPVISEEVWINAFPGLFIASVFYLIPMWNNTFNSTTAEQECGITAYSKLLNNLKKVFPYRDENYLVSNLEIILNDATNLLIAVIPDEANDSNKKLSKLHPTYMPIDGVNIVDNALFTQQALTTQAFNKNLSYMIAYAGGKTTTLESGLSLASINCGSATVTSNRSFVLGSNANVEYYLIMKEDFLTAINAGV